MTEPATGPTFYVRAATTWTADDGAPSADALGRTRQATTRLGRMAAHVVSALPTLPQLRRTRPRWIVASAYCALDGLLRARGAASSALRVETMLPDGVAHELAARVGGLQPWTTIAAGPSTVAMALFEAAGLLGTVTEDVVLVVAEAELPESMKAAPRYEPLAVALHLTADPGPGDLALLAGPDLVREAPPRATGPHAGSPGRAALLLARAALAGEATRVVLEDTVVADPGGPGRWSVEIKPVEATGA